MSADNGIYILPSPMENGGTEYRVAHCQAIDNIDELGLEQEFEVLLFGECQVFSNKEDAWAKACQLADKESFLEYGVCQLPLRQHPFPKMSRERAEFNERLYGLRCLGAKQETLDLMENMMRAGWRPFCWMNGAGETSVELSFNGSKDTVIINYGR